MLSIVTQRAGLNQLVRGARVLTEDVPELEGSKGGVEASTLWAVDAALKLFNRIRCTIISITNR